MINIQDISKSYEKKHALNRISINFESSKTHVLIGSSGCGKSTLLRILMGLIKPSTGTVTINGQEVRPDTQKQIVHQIGYVIQDAGLFPHLTARDNVLLPMRAQKKAKDEMSQRLDSVSHLVGLDINVLRNYPKELSGGQKQRVGLMRALILDPPVLLLDEPLGALDPIVRSTLQSELKRIFNNLKKTVIMVTHDLGEAAFFGHTITLMHKGSLVQSGTFEELVKKPADPFVTEFLKAQRPIRELEALQE
jgi:osmoprotectant transport system ATP-binding protein